MPVSVINMIPNSMSNETQRDAEPNITATFLDPLRIAASPFTPDPLGSGQCADLRLDRRRHHLDAQRRAARAGTRPATPRCASSGRRTCCTPGSSGPTTAISRSCASRTSRLPGSMTALVDQDERRPAVRRGRDRAWPGPAPGTTGSTSARTTSAPPPATRRRSTSRWTPPPRRRRRGSGRTRSRRARRLDRTGRRSGPRSISTGRSTASTWAGASSTTTDIVVVRDDNWGAGATPFTALVDSGRRARRQARRDRRLALRRSATCWGRSASAGSARSRSTRGTARSSTSPGPTARPAPTRRSTCAARPTAA